MSELKDFLNGGGTLAPQVDANTQAIAAKYGDNFIINGCGEVQQRAADSLTGVIDSAWLLDGWRLYNNAGSNIYAVNFTRTSGNYPLPSIQNSLKTTITAVKTPVGSDLLFLSQIVESGVSVGLIDKEFTISFWCKCSKVGKRVVVITAPNFDYSYVATFNIDVADTWEFKQIIITGGLPSNISWKNSSVPAFSFQLRFPLSAATTWETTTPNTWITPHKLWVAGAVDLAAQANNYLEFTGVKIELGNQATSYVVNTAEELLKCKRRFENIALRGVVKANSPSGTYLGGAWPIVQKIAIPVITFSTGGQVSKINLEGSGLVSLEGGGFVVTNLNYLHLDALASQNPVNWWQIDSLIMDCSI